MVLWLLNPMVSQFSIPVLWNLCWESVIAQNVETQLRTLAVRVQLPLGWNTFVLFNTDIVNFVWKTDVAESNILLIFVLWQNLWWVRGGGMEQKVLFRASWNRIFFQSVFFTFKIKFDLKVSQCRFESSSISSSSYENNMLKISH